MDVLRWSKSIQNDNLFEKTQLIYLFDFLQLIQERGAKKVSRKKKGDVLPSQPLKVVVDEIVWGAAHLSS